MPHGTPALAVRVLPAAKPWWASRTLWLNAVALLLAALEAHYAVLQQLLPIDAYAGLVLIVALGNVGLRLVTDRAIELRLPGANDSGAE
jgi:hypothetical protein